MDSLNTLVERIRTMKQEQAAREGRGEPRDEKVDVEIFFADALREALTYGTFGAAAYAPLQQDKAGTSSGLLDYQDPSHVDPDDPIR